ncbi:MAG: phosphopantothenoylcysteine decarboxylase domain-containing protein [Kiritimatiellia bacterium]
MKILVTAGPTREPIDAVRFLSNRSSGKMGYAIAVAGKARGHSVRLVSGPVCLLPPQDIELIRVTTAEEMLKAVLENVAWCDALVMAAAVADWRPARYVPDKLKKTAMKPVLQLEPTPDILMCALAHKGRRIFVGFAAETADLLTEARRKLIQKGLDLVVANDVSRRDAGFECDTNQVTFITREGEIIAFPLLMKSDVATRIIMWLEERAARSGLSAAP